MERSDRRASGARGTRRWRVATVALVGVFVLLLTSCFGDGTYRVGYDPGQLRPGTTYSTAGGQGCHWVEWVGGWLGIVVRGPEHRTTAAERQIHTIGPYTSAAFSSDGCGIWVRTSAQIPLSPPLADKPAGMWRVPTDMAYGTWTAPGGSGCYWARLRDFLAGGRSIITSHSGGGRPVVRVGRSVHGFESTGCGTWHWHGTG